MQLGQSATPTGDDHELEQHENDGKSGDPQDDHLPKGAHAARSGGRSPLSRATRSRTVMITTCSPGSVVPFRFATTRPIPASSLPRSVSASVSQEPSARNDPPRS
jgi:hypothetical protein